MADKEETISDGALEARRTLSVLPFSLVLASIRKDQLWSCTAALLKLLIFPDRENRFFSYTIANDEVSLVIEQRDLSLFPSDALQYTNQIRRAIHVDEGPLGFESTGIVSSISTPLARAKISMYYLSTYQTDFTIVPEEELDKAVTVLRNAGFFFSKGAPVTTPDVSPPHAHTPNALPSSAQMAITQCQSSLFLLQLPRDWFKTLTRPILHILFFNGCVSADGVESGVRCDQQFFSITETPFETSVVADERVMGLLQKEGIECCPVTWRALQICEGAYGVNDGDIVSKFSYPLAEAAISIFNVSTYFTDYALVGESNLDVTLKILQDTFNVIMDEE